MIKSNDSDGILLQSTIFKTDNKLICDFSKENSFRCSLSSYRFLNMSILYIRIFYFFYKNLQFKDSDMEVR